MSYVVNFRVYPFQYKRCCAITQIVALTERESSFLCPKLQRHGLSVSIACPR